MDHISRFHYVEDFPPLSEPSQHNGYNKRTTQGHNRSSNNRSYNCRPDYRMERSRIPQLMPDYQGGQSHHWEPEQHSWTQWQEQVEQEARWQVQRRAHGYLGKGYQQNYNQNVDGYVLPTQNRYDYMFQKNY